MQSKCSTYSIIQAGLLLLALAPATICAGLAFIIAAPLFVAMVVMSAAGPWAGFEGCLSPMQHEVSQVVSAVPIRHGGRTSGSNVACRILAPVPWCITSSMQYAIATDLTLSV